MKQIFFQITIALISMHYIFAEKNEAGQEIPKQHKRTMPSREQVINNFNSSLYYLFDEIKLQNLINDIMAKGVNNNDYFLTLMELHEKLEDNITQIINDKLKILQIGQTAIKELQNETYTQFIHDTYNNKPVNHSTYNDVMKVIEIIIGSDKYQETFGIAKEKTRIKLQNHNLSSYDGTPEWYQAYPRILKTEFLNALLQQGKEFKQQIQNVEDFQMLLPGGKEKIEKRKQKYQKEKQQNSNQQNKNSKATPQSENQKREQKKSDL